MRHFSITENQVLYKGHKDFLVGADIHYFRINPEDWKDRIEKALEMGCNIVSVYIPWMAHEIEEGYFDFTGETHPRRNIIGFLQLLKDMDVAVIAKPGPYVYSELPGQGFPNWFIKKHPNAWAKIWNGTEFVSHGGGDTAPLSYLHPEFLEGADKWLQKICSVIAPFQRSQTGSVEAVQICNEIAGIHIWGAGYDANPETLGLGHPDGLYASFYKSKYDTLDELNRIHHASYDSFSDVPIPIQGPKASEETRRILVSDYSDFYYNYYITRYVSWLVERFKAHGIDELLTTNIAFPEMVMQMRQPVEQYPEVFPGIDLYYTFIHNKILSARNISYCCEFGPQILEKVTKKPPIAFEFQAGAPDELDYVLYEPYAYIWALWSMIGGYKGLNLYVLAGGNNLPRAGSEGSTYNYQAPIASDGEVRDTYYGFRRAFQDARSVNWILDSKLVTDVSVAVCDFPGFRDNPLRNVIEGLFRNNLSPHVFLLDREDQDTLSELPIVWTAPGPRLSADDQMKLLRFVEEGGTLILTGDLPSMAMDFTKCTVLTDSLGIKIEESRTEDFNCLLFNGQEMGVSAYRTVKGREWSEVIAVLADGSPSVVVFKHKLGKVVVAPFDMSFSTELQAKLFKAICDAAGISPIAKSRRARVMVRELPDGSRWWFALNYHPIELNETIDVCGKEHSLSLKPYGITWGQV